MGITVYPNYVQDIMLEAPAGNIPGYSAVNKFGNNPALATSSTETVWDGSNAYTFPATADITHISQAVDQVTMRGETIEVEGLDTNYALVTQTADLDGSDTTTSVALGTALRRIFRMKALSSVVTTQNVIATNSGGGTTYAQITAGNNQTLMAIYTIPAGKTGYITKYYASLNKDSGGGDPDVVIRVWQRDNENGYAPQIKHVLGLDSGATSLFQHVFNPYYKISEKNDFYIEATNLSGTATADVSAGFDIILVDN